RGKGLSEATNLKVLEPACGSGSLLLGAYQFLLDCKQIQPADGSRRLSLSERLRILLDHIHGVDIDPEGVEITKRSLILKLFENASGAMPPGRQRALYERAYSGLAGCIKCGNALIGPDYLDERADSAHRIETFDWQTEFKSILESGGFSVVIGNPPWGQKDVLVPEAIKRFVRQRYPSA